MAEKKYGDYTQGIDDVLAVSALDEDDDYEAILDYINKEIRSFPERLLRFYNKQTGQELSAAAAKDDLLKKAKEKGIALNRNTMNSWFTDTSPKMDDSARKNLFKIAFVLGLDVKETGILFNDVLLDRSFIYRRKDEFIYFFCLRDRIPYNIAETLIATVQAEKNAPVKDETVLTYQIRDFALKADEKEIIKYIQSHPHNFSMNNVTGARIMEEKWEEITGSSENKGLAQMESELQEYQEYDEKGKAKSVFANQSKYSSDFALRIIFGTEHVRKAGEKNVFKEQFRKEIANQFPDKQSIKKTDSAYVLRKNLILIYFYWYWVKAKLAKDSAADYESFCDELDSVLNESGLSMLYPGNPYDALFLYCAYSGDSDRNPLDVFRGIIDFVTEGLDL
ncbi:MAG: hypothetical protein IJH53_04595 [Oscillospiraceae bacterium]|nr:hypothetical protein [Oscillospiraceae bacterium]